MSTKKQNERRRAVSKRRQSQPDWNYWLREIKWELQEAALLLQNIEPRTVDLPKLKELLTGFDDKRARVPADDDGTGAELVKLAEIMRRSRDARRGGRRLVRTDYDPDGTPREWVRPRDFLRWASRKGYRLPDAPAKFADVAPSQQTQNVEQLRDLQQAYDAIRTETGKTPSQRAVTKKSGYARETVRTRWGQLKK